jgi:hypothetical protein
MRVKLIQLAFTVLFASVASGQARAEDSVDRVFHFTHVETPQGFQEIATVMRTVAGIRQLSVSMATRALAMRGTADQAALAGWLFNELDKPDGAVQQGQNSGTHEYRVPGSSDDVVRVFYLTHTDTAQGLQEIVTVLRTVAEIQRIFSCNAPRSVALRGTAEQMAVAEWLFNALDKAASGQSLARLGQDSGMYEYRVTGNSDDVLRVFYLTHTDTVQGLQEIVTTIRTIADIQRIFVCNASRALTLRGTVDQVARSARLIEELDRPGAR